MLYQVGPVQIDTFPFPANEVRRDRAYDYAVHPLLGRRQGREPVGDGDDVLEYRGVIIPIREMTDGREELEKLAGAMAGHEPQLVMRGDSEGLGWYVIESINETHTHIQRDGVGAQIEVQFRLVKVRDGQGRSGRTGAAAGPSLFNSILSFFR